MPIEAKYVLMVSMDVAPEKEDLFNEVYDQEHIPNLLEVPGVLSARRVKSQAGAIAMAGATKEIPAASPAYTAIYELESPDVLQSDAWAKAVEAGRWPDEVRPYTTNRRQVLARVL